MSNLEEIIYSILKSDESYLNSFVSERKQIDEIE